MSYFHKKREIALGINDTVRSVWYIKDLHTEYNALIKSYTEGSHFYPVIARVAKDVARALTYLGIDYYLHECMDKSYIKFIFDTKAYFGESK